MSARQLQARLARELLRQYPERAADVLERVAVQEGARLLRQFPVDEAAAAVRAMAPNAAAASLAAVDPQRAAAITAKLLPDVASALLRRIDEGARAAILDELTGAHAQRLRAVLRFPPDTAGALMDPAVLAIPEDLTAREAVARVRERPRDAHYNVYVVDRTGCLVGVLNLRELFLARPRSVLSEVMKRAPRRLEAEAPSVAIVEHPGWKEVHALPVVDADGRYLGAVRYGTLRRLEAELHGRPVAEKDTGEALGELYAAGFSAVLDVLAGTAGRGGR